MIEFHCPSCSHPLTATEDKAGAEARCPGCGQSVVIPYPPASATAAPLPAAVDGSASASLTPDERQWGMLCHLSGLIANAAAGMSFLGPLICLLIKQKESKWVEYHAKEALNFHLNIIGYYLIAIAITAATCGFAFFVLAFPPIYSIIMSIIGAMQANEGKRYEYPAIVRLIT